MSVTTGVYGRFRAETVIERSRFIATCARAENEENARAFVAEIRAEFSDATHNCYAFAADKLGNLLRFSDDGEPQGTAGTPILEAIRGRKLYETAVVVTRYFGGIKLGAGGLARAYSAAAGACLDGAEKRSFEPCTSFAVTVGYELADLIKKFVSSHDCTLSNVEYSDRVCLHIAVRSRRAQDFFGQLTDYAAGRARIEKTDEYYFPFEIE